MATKRNANSPAGDEGNSLSRTDRLLAVLLLGQQPNAKLWDKIKMLRSAGLTNTEIGEILGMSGSAVGKTYYDATKRSGSKKRKS